MSKISAFLNPIAVNETKEVVVSKRFLDEDGSPATIKIRAVSQAENERLTAAATRRERKGGKISEHLDTVDYSKRLVLAAVVEPDLRDPEFAKQCGCIDAADVMSNLLLVGEYAKLIEEITALSGLESDVEIEEAAKN